MQTTTNEPSLIVQKQLEAYNARDMDAYLACWTDDCRHYAFPDQLLATGKEDVRQRFAVRFGETNLHARLIHRMEVDGVVIDREVITRTFPEGPGEVDLIAIYEVENGRIARGWFKTGTPRLHGQGG